MTVDEVRRVIDLAARHDLIGPLSEETWYDDDPQGKRDYTRLLDEVTSDVALKLGAVQGVRS